MATLPNIELVDTEWRLIHGVKAGVDRYYIQDEGHQGFHVAYTETNQPPLGDRAGFNVGQAHAYGLLTMNKTEYLWGKSNSTSASITVTEFPA